MHSYRFGTRLGLIALGVALGIATDSTADDAATRSYRRQGCRRW